MCKTGEMRLWRKRTRVEGKTEPQISNWLAGKIAGGINRLQEKFANKMNNRIGNMVTKKLKVWLILFCIVAGGYSGWLIVRAVMAETKAENAFRVEPINQPAHLNKSGDETTMAKAQVDDYTVGQIHAFKEYMDSLRTHNVRLYDSITTARPRLMDSVLALEQLYHLQHKK